MTDLLGPANAPGAVTARPAESRIFDTIDTWFKDCTSPDIDDGTDFQAAYFNGMLAVARHLVRANGSTAGAAKIVAEDNSDPGLLTKAVQHMIQRGLMSYGTDSGSADALVVTLSPTLAEYKAGAAPIRILKGGSPNATTTPTINIDGNGVKTIVSRDGTPIEIGELAASSILSLQYDGTNMRLMSPPAPASVAEVEAGTLFHKFVSPATLLQRRIPFFVLNDAGGSTGLASGVNTNLSHLTSDAGHFFGDGASSIASSRFLCGTKDAGLWIIGANYGAATGVAGQFNVAVAVNGVGSPIVSGYNPGATYGFSCTRTVRLAAGDIVQVQAFQNTGGTLSAQSAQLSGLRMGG
jgi:hypothetical protein